MAATADKYYNNGISKRSAKIVAVTQHDIPMALMLAEYGTVANIKALFYLDYVRRMAKKDANGNVVYVFIGLCKVGSANYNMHAEARRSRRRMSRTLDGVTREDYVWFNDGGLNTKGEILSLSLASALETGGFKFDSVFKSGYYVACDVYVRFRKNGESSWANAFHFRSIGEKVTYTEDDRFVNLDDFYAVTAGQLYDAQVYISNPEGTHFSDIKTVTIQPYVVRMRTGSNPANAYNNTTIINVYPNTRSIDVGTVFYEIWGQQQRYPNEVAQHERSPTIAANGREG